MELRQETWTENKLHEIIKKDGAVERTICTSGVFKPSAVFFFFFHCRYRSCSVISLGRGMERAKTTKIY